MIGAPAARGASMTPAPTVGVTTKHAGARGASSSAMLSSTIPGIHEDVIRRLCRAVLIADSVGGLVSGNSRQLVPEPPLGVGADVVLRYRCRAVRSSELPEMVTSNRRRDMHAALRDALSSARINGIGPGSHEARKTHWHHADQQRSGRLTEKHESSLTY
jgi:hypothetical protein